MPIRSCVCGGVVRNGKCSRCYKTKKNKARYEESAHKRGYGSDWQKFREQYLTNSRLCVDCEETGRPNPATELHHIKKVVDYPHLRLDPKNIMPLCKSCHSKRTARGE